MTKLVGVDVGGTFTDLVLVDEVTGEVRLAKVPTTPRNQAAGVLAALTAAAATPAELKVIVHGTTTATNALNDRHERRAREIAAGEWPNAYITVGSELLPEYREFERGTTAAINGFVQPVIDRYLRTLSTDS
jgi:N-methylhydantoinase A/oxoprolinase/acetone carboxylase beta subunit